MNVRRLSAGVSALLFGLAGVLVVLNVQVGIFSISAGFVALTLVLLFYLWQQVMLVRRSYPERWLLNPAVLCSLLTFALAHGVTNVVYFFPEDQLASVGISSEITIWMFYLLALALLAAIAMWMAYWAPFSAKLGKRLSRSRFMTRVLRRDWNYRPTVLVALVGISLASRLLAVRLGVYGFSSDIGRLQELGGITQYISMTSALGLLALAVVALRYFAPSERPLDVVWWFWSLLAIELVAGLLSGFKSQVAMPIIVVGVCMYIRRGLIPWRWMVWVPVAISIAYAVIEPFRAARYADSSFDGTSLQSISGTMKRSYLESAGNRSEEEANTLVSFMARSNILRDGSLGIEYESNGTLSNDRPNFLMDIFLAPFYAVMPRMFFDFKPSGSLGTWYRVEVLGGGEGNTSIAMGPLTYLYFAGGALAVFFGFFYIGLMQRALSEVYVFAAGSGAAIIFLVLITLFVQIDSAFYSINISLVRNIPIALVLQWLIYRR